MLICGKIFIEFTTDWIFFFSTIKVLKPINKNFRTPPQPLLPQDNLHPGDQQQRVSLRVLVAEQEYVEGFGGCPVIFQMYNQLVPTPNRDSTSCPFHPTCRGASNKERGLEIRRATPSSIRKKRLPPGVDAEWLPEMPWGLLLAQEATSEPVLTARGWLNLKVPPIFS